MDEINYEAIDIKDLEPDIEQVETVEYVEVKDVEEVVVETDEAFASFGSSDAVVKHNDLKDRDVSDQHPIEAITGLEYILNELSSPRTVDVYTVNRGYAEFRPWKDKNKNAEGRLGYFVSLVDNNDNNEWIKICNAEYDDVYGVTVRDSGFCGGQYDEYNMFIEKSLNKSADTSWAKVCLIGTVMVRVSSTENFNNIHVGDFVIPHTDGCAIKSKNNIGYKVVMKEAAGIGENGWNKVFITLVPQNDNIARVMKKLEETNEGLGELNIQIGNLDEKVETNISISGKFDELEEYIKGEATDNINAAKEAFETAQSISNETIAKIETMTTNYEEAMNQVEMAKSDAQAALSQINDYDLKTLAEYKGNIVGFFANASADEVTFGTVARTQGDVAMIKQTSKELQNLVCHIDVYSVGTQSPTSELSYDEAQGALGPYEYIYVPTSDHTENSPVYICATPLEQDTWYEFTIDGNTYYFKSTIGYTSAMLQFNIRTKRLTIDNEDVDTQERTPHNVTVIPIASEFTSEKSMTFKVRDIDEYTSLGNSYIWTQIDGGFWWTEVEKSVLHYSEGEPTGDYGLWYTSNGVKDQDGNFIYNSGTLYRKTESSWIAVATINDKNARTMSYINKAADEISSTITNVGDQVSTISQRVDAIELSVKEGENLSQIQQTAKNIRLGVYESGGGESELELLLSGLRSDAVHADNVWVCDVLDTWPSSENTYYSEPPVWDGTQFSFNDKFKTSQDVNTYCSGVQQNTYYKLVSKYSYEVYTHGNTAMASINTRVNKNESAVESWTQFKTDVSNTMTKLAQNSTADVAELAAIVIGEFQRCVETKTELTTDEISQFDGIKRYDEAPGWGEYVKTDENGTVTSKVKGYVFTTNSSDNGVYCVLNDVRCYYELTLDNDDNIVGYKKYEMKSSPSSSIVQKVEDGKSYIGLFAGDDDKMGSIVARTINDKSEVLIEADKIGIAGTAVFNDSLTDGKTTISGNNIRTGVIRSNNYSGPVTYKMYGAEIGTDEERNKIITASNNINNCVYYTPIMNGTFSYNGDNFTYYYAKDIKVNEILSTSEQEGISVYIVSEQDFDLIPTSIETIGTKFDLNNGAIYSENFSLDRNGSLTIAGKITATSGYIGDADNGFEITKGDPYYFLSNNQTSLYGNRIRSSSGVYIGPNGIGLGDGGFAVDSQGNLDTIGDVNMWTKVKNEDGSISWSKVVSIDSENGNLTLAGNITLGGSITWNTSSNPVCVLYHSGAKQDTDGSVIYVVPDKPDKEYSSYAKNATWEWHKVFQKDFVSLGTLYPDYYASYSYDGGKTWTDAIKVRGEDGYAFVEYDEVKNILEDTYNITQTEIDGESIQSPTIRAANLYGANIYGCNLTTIDTDTGAKIVINADGITSYNSYDQMHGLVAHPNDEISFDDGFSLYSLGDRIFSVVRYGNEAIIKLNTYDSLNDSWIEQCSISTSGNTGKCHVYGTWQFEGPVNFNNSVTGITATFG